MIAARKTRPPKTERETVPEEQHFVVDGVTWEQYEAIANAFPDRYIRVTYDNGWLELMTVSNYHERIKMLLDRVLLVLAEVFRLPMGAFGSFTHKKKKILKALEPDNCYYLANFEKVKGYRLIDLGKDPPPDLVMEMEISRSFLDRMKILAALGVAELWLVNEERLEVNVLRDGKYEKVEESPTFPGLDLNQVLPFLQMGWKEGDFAMMEAVRKWARAQLRKKKPRG